MKRSPLVVLMSLSLSVAGARAQQLDLIVHGGSVVDGSGAPAAKADVGILGDRIVFVGSSAGRTAKRTLDADRTDRNAGLHRPSYPHRRRPRRPQT